MPTCTRATSSPTPGPATSSLSISASWAASTRKERRFLADILYGFITRNYRHDRRAAFRDRLCAAHQSVDDFALALRSIGEPLHGRKANDISMAKVFGQLFATTELFDMQTRPELVLLQKSMVIVEGVARSLDPELDVWTISEPVVGDWVRREAGPLGRLRISPTASAPLPIRSANCRRSSTKPKSHSSDYEADKRSAARRNSRTMIIAGFWLLVALAVLLIWRLIG